MLSEFCKNLVIIQDYWYRFKSGSGSKNVRTRLDSDHKVTIYRAAKPSRLF